MAYSDLHETFLCPEVAVRLEYVPTELETLRLVRRDLEKTRRLLRSSLTHSVVARLCDRRGT